MTSPETKTPIPFTPETAPSPPVAMDVAHQMHVGPKTPYSDTERLITDKSRNLVAAFSGEGVGGRNVAGIAASNLRSEADSVNPGELPSVEDAAKLMDQCVEASKEDLEDKIKGEPVIEVLGRDKDTGEIIKRDTGRRGKPDRRYEDSYCSGAVAMVAKDPANENQPTLVWQSFGDNSLMVLRRHEDGAGGTFIQPIHLGKPEMKTTGSPGTGGAGKIDRHAENALGQSGFNVHNRGELSLEPGDRIVVMTRDSKIPPDAALKDEDFANIAQSSKPDKAADVLMGIRNPQRDKDLSVIVADVDNPGQAAPGRSAPAPRGHRLPSRPAAAEVKEPSEELSLAREKLAEESVRMSRKIFPMTSREAYNDALKQYQDKLEAKYYELVEQYRLAGKPREHIDESIVDDILSERDKFTERQIVYMQRTSRRNNLLTRPLGRAGQYAIKKQGAKVAAVGAAGALASTGTAEVLFDAAEVGALSAVGAAAIVGARIINGRPATYIHPYEGKKEDRKNTRKVEYEHELDRWAQGTKKDLEDQAEADISSAPIREVYQHAADLLANSVRSQNERIRKENKRMLFGAMGREALKGVVKTASARVRSRSTTPKTKELSFFLEDTPTLEMEVIHVEPSSFRDRTKSKLTRKEYLQSLKSRASQKVNNLRDRSKS